MTNQEKIKFLRQYQSILQKVEILQNDLIRWHALGEKITPALTGMPQGGQNAPKVEQAVVMICETEDQIKERIEQLSNVYVQILKAIESVDDITLQNLLHRRYIDGQTFEEIAYQMHYSWRWIHRLHRKALEKVDTEKSS